MRIALVFLVFTAFGSGMASAASQIERACLKHGRAGATPALCGCIQSVANRTLSRADQRLAATFFKDPHKAQVIRQSDRSSHEAFWQRYKVFGATAGEVCDPANS